MRVLIVGGGIGGMSAAMKLRDSGHHVELIDKDPEWRVYGAGITITRPTMRAFRDLGVLEQVIQGGFAGDGIQVCMPDGTPVGLVEDPDLLDDGLPGSGGIMRPELHRILSGNVLSRDTHVRLGITADAIENRGDHVAVGFSDGSKGVYDLVVGADGAFSQTRSMIFPDAPIPKYTGQMVWRLYARRPANITRRHYFLGGKVKIGVTPVSSTHLYMFLLENTDQADIIDDEEAFARLHSLMAGYGGVVADLRADLGPDSQIVVRPLEAFLLGPPWYSGRVLLIGDAAHPTTPQLASGAGLAVEDALVLNEEIAKAGNDVPLALQSFMERRWPRCRTVVENSIEIGQREREGRNPQEQTQLVEESLAVLAEPI
jgi:2-polyprenyl-6-methoxyphenol hydroxylase-like FAD-dependent oxidoreductase